MGGAMLDPLIAFALAVFGWVMLILYVLRMAALERRRRLARRAVRP